MELERDAIKTAIRNKVILLAKELGEDASDIEDDDIIPATGLLDSAAILALVVWFEETYDFPLEQDEINIDNLGSINAMADFLLLKKGGLCLRKRDCLIRNKRYRKKLKVILLATGMVVVTGLQPHNARYFHTPVDWGVRLFPGTCPVTSCNLPSMKYIRSPVLR